LQFSSAGPLVPAFQIGCIICLEGERVDRAFN